MALVSLLPQCENSEKLSLLNLFGLIAKYKPSLLESNLPHLSECLTIPSTAASALQIFLDMAAVRPQSFTEHVQKMKMAAELQSGTLVLVARILGIIGKLSMVVHAHFVFLCNFVSARCSAFFANMPDITTSVYFDLAHLCNCKCKTEFYCDDNCRITSGMDFEWFIATA
ncbi:uncharacterized protein LOC118203568 [Stegodyphus dumicola]|uniref:uncharacterized protein LOC118203568 n=1 Tax=Stegodyphus dumicola TaxID=202533 RepID=UPI0015A81FC0|nr:uncharacterized protein LOC118203568 [Stegodyphus dumicola]